MITNNSSPDVYRKLLLVSSNEHCMWVFIIPDVAVLAIEVPVSREEGLISKQDVRGKDRIGNISLQKPPDKLNTRCEVIRLQSLHLLEVVCVQILFPQHSPH